MTISTDQLSEMIMPIIEETVRDTRYSTLSAAVEMCEIVYSRGGTADDCRLQIQKMRDRMPPPASKQEGVKS